MDANCDKFCYTQTKTQLVQWQEFSYISRIMQKLHKSLERCIWTNLEREVAEWKSWWRGDFGRQLTTRDERTCDIDLFLHFIPVDKLTFREFWILEDLSLGRKNYILTKSVFNITQKHVTEHWDNHTKHKLFEDEENSEFVTYWIFRPGFWRACAPSTSTGLIVTTFIVMVSK